MSLEIALCGYILDPFFPSHPSLFKTVFPAGQPLTLNPLTPAFNPRIVHGRAPAQVQPSGLSAKQTRRPLEHLASD